MAQWRPAELLLTQLLPPVVMSIALWEGIGSVGLFSQAAPGAPHDYYRCHRGQGSRVPLSVWAKVISSTQLFMVLSDYSKRTTGASSEQHIHRACKLLHSSCTFCYLRIYSLLPFLSCFQIANKPCFKSIVLLLFPYFFFPLLSDFSSEILFSLYNSELYHLILSH